MKLKSLIFLIFMCIFLFAMLVYEAILTQKIKEQIMIFIIIIFGIIIFEVVKKQIFTKIIESRKEIIEKRIKVITLLEKIKDYNDFIVCKDKVIILNNQKYFRELVIFFYSVYNYDISEFENINKLLINKKRIVKEILISIDYKKEKTYRKLHKDFKIIKKSLNYDSGFVTLYYKFKNQNLFNKVDGNFLTTFLAVISIIGFAFTLAIATLDIKPMDFFKTLAIYFIVMLFLQSFLGVIDYSNEYYTEISSTNSIITTLTNLGDIENEKS